MVVAVLFTFLPRSPLGQQRFPQQATAEVVRQRGGTVLMGTSRKDGLPPDVISVTLYKVYVPAFLRRQFSNRLISLGIALSTVAISWVDRVIRGCVSLNQACKTFRSDLAFGLLTLCSPEHRNCAALWLNPPCHYQMPRDTRWRSMV
jgi:hypothetical protein